MSDEVYHLTLRPRADPLRRQGLPGRAPVYRLKRAVKYAARACGFDVTVTLLPPAPEGVPVVLPPDDAEGRTGD